MRLTPPLGISTFLLKSSVSRRKFIYFSMSFYVVLTGPRMGAGLPSAPPLHTRGGARGACDQAPC